MRQDNGRAYDQADDGQSDSGDYCPDDPGHARFWLSLRQYDKVASRVQNATGSFSISHCHLAIDV